MGTIVQAEVQSVRPFGIFVRMKGFSQDGLVHSSQVSADIAFTREDEDEMKVHGRLPELLRACLPRPRIKLIGVIPAPILCCTLPVAAGFQSLLGRNLTSLRLSCLSLPNR